MHGGARAARVHLGDVGNEEHVDALGFGDRGVAREIARVAGKVLGRRELGRVHEEADDDEVVGTRRGAHERAMALVEEPHGRDQSHPLTGRARGLARGPDLGDRRQGDHEASPSRSRRAASSRPLSRRASAASARYVGRSSGGNPSR